MSVFPAKQQTPDVQAKDESDCYAWAKQNTGIDPAAPAAPAADAPASCGGGGGGNGGGSAFPGVWKYEQSSFSFVNCYTTSRTVIDRLGIPPAVQG